MLNELIASLNTIIDNTKLHAPILIKIIAIPWFVYSLNLLIFQQQLLYLGIIPRRLRGLPGILFAPLLHANFNHLFFNSIPLLVLSNFILINGFIYYLVITIVITWYLYWRKRFDYRLLGTLSYQYLCSRWCHSYYFRNHFRVLFCRYLLWHFP
jgi:hypothetical protein